ncbi:hypothetical protein ABFS82_02G086200 [Erythranthe guttata]
MIPPLPPLSPLIALLRSLLPAHVTVAFPTIRKPSIGTHRCQKPNESYKLFRRLWTNEDEIKQFGAHNFSQQLGISTGMVVIMFVKAIDLADLKAIDCCA